MAMRTFGLGVAAGVVLAILMRALETSRIELGPFALYGNGAVIVPGIGPALALMPIWTWALRRHAGVIALVTVPIGLAIGLGTYGVLASGNAGDLAISILGNGLIFVTPTALTGALVRWLFRGARPDGIRAALFLAFGLPFGLLFPMITAGISAGLSPPLRSTRGCAPISCSPG